jgi:hypothetical protein
MSEVEMCVVEKDFLYRTLKAIKRFEMFPHRLEEKEEIHAVCLKLCDYLDGVTPETCKHVDVDYPENSTVGRCQKCKGLVRVK